MIRFLLYLALLSTSSPCISATTAKIQGFTLKADELYQDTENEFIELIGNVHILYQNQEIRSNKAVIFTKSKKAIFVGQVYIKTPQAEIEGDEVISDYDGDTGLIKNGTVKSNNILFQGRVIQKLSSIDYYVLDANYTTCTNCPSTWAFDGSQIRAELGGYAYLKNTLLKFGGVPVFWFPYLVLPINSQRESGLLPPSFEYGQEVGTIVTLSYFWAINRSTDATFTLKNYELAGQKGILEYRYILSENSYGQFQTGLIRDRLFANDPRVNAYRPDDKKGTIINRWFIKYDHYYELPQNYVNRAQFNLASDLQYSKDFPKETIQEGDSAMENRVSFTKNTRDQHFSVDTSYYINQLHADPLSGNDDAVHRLPSLHFSQVNKSFGPLLLSFDADYTNFFRNGKSYDSIAEKDGVKFVANDKNDPECENKSIPCRTIDTLPYDPNKDIIRTGQRLDIQPVLTYSFKPTPWLNVLPKFLYKETRYIFNVGDEKQNVRRFVRAEVTSRTKFSRVYGNLNDDAESFKQDRYKHEIIPELTYTAIPWKDSENHPFFGFGNNADSPYIANTQISDSDLNSNKGLQFDYNDRIYGQHLLTYSLLNQVIRRKTVNKSHEYYNLASLKISQSYDFFEASKNEKNNEPFYPIESVLVFNLPGATTNTTLKYYPYQKVTNSSLNLSMSNLSGQFMRFGFTRNYSITPKQPVDTTTRTENLSFAAGFTSGYINLMGAFVYNLNWINSDPKISRITRVTWITQLKPPGECWVINLAFDQKFGSRQITQLSYAFNFDGKPLPPLPPEALNEYGY